jgi:beta-galactosidase
MKGAGAVMARLIHYPEAPNLLDYLDQKGMLIYCEIPVWGGGDPQMKPNNPITKQWLREMIDRDYNHPCIIGWSTGNELQSQYAYVDSMTRYVRDELDPSRLTGYVSNTAADKWHNPKNDPVTVSDIAMINKYGGPKDFSSAAAAVRSKWPDKPVFFSEYGVKQIGASLTARIPNIDGILADMEKQPYVIGGALWTFNDYRNGFKKGGSASGNREWGVVDIDRHPKAAYWQIRKLYSPVHSLTVDNGTVTVQPRTSQEIPSYALRGYQLAWQVLDADHKVTAEGKLPLPDLAPNAPAWTSPIPGAQSAPGVKVTLLSPTGYDVDSVSYVSGEIPSTAGAQ